MAEPSPHFRTPFTWWIVGLAAVALVAAVAAGISARANGEIESLPAPERQALYQRTLATLRTSCMQASGPILTDYCREQATFIQRFPECDSECRTLADRFTPPPSR